MYYQNKKNFTIPKEWFFFNPENLSDSKKLNTDIWYEENTYLWVKAAFDKTGYWEYRLKLYK